MEIEADDKTIQSCLRQIERQLGWGSGEEWSTQDFESLSKKIQEATGVTLSVATLKRIWGKIRYDSKPTVTTLNTLAQFIGYENWRTFKQHHSSNGNTNGKTNGHDLKNIQPTISHPKKRPRSVVTFIFVLILLVVAAYYILPNYIQPSTPINPEAFQFSSKKVVDEGVPNTVIFDYDATTANESDSVFIQQSWDKRLSTLVDRNQKQHTSIYYYPGFFAAKLRINELVVKEHNLTITTKGWVPLIEQKPVPVYFKEADALKDGSFGLSLEQITQSNIPLQPKPPQVAYFNVSDFGEVTTKDLILETQLKNDYAEGANACQFTEIVLLFEGGGLVIPLSAKGCVSELQFMGHDGKKSDLSILGCDFNDWVNIRVSFLEKSLKVFIADDLMEFPISSGPVKLIGLAYKFQGTGSVKSIQVRNQEGRIYYSEDFIQ